MYTKRKLISTVSQFYEKASQVKMLLRHGEMRIKIHEGHIATSTRAGILSMTGSNALGR
mgnify:CR=1 FL=1|jgi:hypothetical protein